MLLYFPKEGDVYLAVTCFIIANVAFEMGHVFCNSYLPDISSKENIGRISGFAWGIGFVGGLWTLLRFAVNKKNKFFEPQNFHFEFLENTLLPLLKKNIQLQLDAGVEIVMIFDSGLGDLNSVLFMDKYVNLIKDLSNSFPHKIGYYCKGKKSEEVKIMLNFQFAGLGIDHNLDIVDFLSNKYAKVTL